MSAVATAAAASAGSTASASAASRAAMSAAEVSVPRVLPVRRALALHIRVARERPQGMMLPRGAGDGSAVSESLRALSGNTAAAAAPGWCTLGTAGRACGARRRAHAATAAAAERLLLLQRRRELRDAQVERGAAGHVA